MVAWVRASDLRSGINFFPGDDVVYGEIRRDDRNNEFFQRAIQPNILANPPNSLTAPFPLAGCSYSLLSGGIVESAITTLGLRRLDKVRVLATLHDPRAALNGGKPADWRFPHSRFLHVCDAAAILNRVGLNNNLSSKLLRHGKLAAISHDALTPAHGDAVKLIDPRAFDEDANIGKLFTKPEIKEWLKRQGIELDLVIRTVQGQGLLGALLDWADKIAYLSRDLFYYITRFDLRGIEGHEANFLETVKAVSELAFGFNVWESLRVLNDQVYGMNPEQVYAFLKLRALAIRQIYRDPWTRFMEIFFDRVVVWDLYQTGRITSDELLIIDDQHLDEIIAEVVGHDQPFNHPSCLGKLGVETFAKADEALKRQEELEGNGRSCVSVIDVVGRIKSATRLLCENRGKVMAFKDAKPEWAQEIEEICASKPYRVYYILDPDLKPTYLEPLRRFRRDQLTLVENMH